MGKGWRRRGLVLISLLALLGALVIAGCGGGGSSSSTTTTTEETAPAETETEPAETAEGGIAEAPAFTSDELNEEAGANWITNGGNLTNDRFSRPR